MGGEAVDAAILPLDGQTVVIVVRVPMEHAGRLGEWEVEVEGGRVLVTPPPCPFVVDYRVRETGETGRVRGPLGGEPVGFRPGLRRP